jgi:hypothetical protein
MRCRAATVNGLRTVLFGVGQRSADRANKKTPRGVGEPRGVLLDVSPLATVAAALCEPQPERGQRAQCGEWLVRSA